MDTEELAKPNIGRTILVGGAILGALLTVIGVIYFAAVLIAGPMALDGRVPTIGAIPDWAATAIDVGRPASAMDREERIMAAQEAMSTFAFWMLFVALITAVTTTVGTALLLYQMTLTRRALDEASKANRIAADGREMELRPYLSATLKIEDSYHWSVTVENGGRTPAIDCIVSMKADVFNNREATSVAGSRGAFWFSLSPGKSEHFQDSLPRFSSRVDGALVPDEFITTFTVVILYRDFFGGERETSAQFTRQGHRARLIPDTTGNHHT